MSYIENKIINAFILFIILFFVLFVSLSFFKYQDYILTYGETENDYVNIFLTDQEITSLNYKLKYNGYISNYIIKEVSNNYILHNNELKRNVKIQFTHDNDKYILELYLEVGDEINIWEKIYKKYMKGVI